MGGPNLEVFKFGMYIMFPIGIMYYFGTNLDAKFHTPDFWPKQGQTHTIPFEKEEITEELDRLRRKRLAARARRREIEGWEPEVQQQQHAEQAVNQTGPSPLLQTLQHTQSQGLSRQEGQKSAGGGWGSWFK